MKNNFAKRTDCRRVQLGCFQLESLEARRLATVSGSVFNDEYASGKRQPGDPGLAGFTVYLDLNRDGQLDAGDESTVTDSKGHYSFSNLPVGRYAVNIVGQQSYRLTSPSGLPATVKVTNRSTHIAGPTFAETQDALISGTVLDSGSNKPLSGFRVYLDLSSDGNWESNEPSFVTGKNGKWSLNIPAPGTYAVGVVTRSGYTVVSPFLSFVVGKASARVGNAISCVTTAGPTHLSARQLNPNEISLAWTEQNAAVYTTTYIDFSTDGGRSFSPFDEVDNATVSYVATGLIPNTKYVFELVSGSESLESDPSNPATAYTAVDPWHSNASGGTSVLEGKLYTLKLSTHPSASAPSFGYWYVDWGDGSTDTYTIATETVTHLISPGLTFADISATAYPKGTPLTVPPDSYPGAIVQQPISVDVIPIAPSGLIAKVASPSEVDLNWSDNNSQSANGYNIYRSDGGGPFNLIDTVAYGTNTYVDSTVAYATSKKLRYQVAAEGDNQSILSAASTSNIVTI